MTLQNNIEAGGDVAGGNIDKSQKSYHFNVPANGHVSLLQPFLDIIEKLEKGHEVDIENELEDIDHYSQQHRTDKRGLAQKLNDSGRAYMVDEALRYKMKAARFILKNQDKPALQYLIGRILSKIKITYDSLVVPLIQADAPIQTIEEIIFKEVITPIQNTLIGTPLSSNDDCVIHLMYFLAGNCHICWDKKC
ncbi:ABC-three component system protein [Acinetobacter indicus]|uniref:ABC-three component system protein n=1 Tax=Acinetobacter indicus TaxID=756892 RepID=UPI0034CD444C